LPAFRHTVRPRAVERPLNARIGLVHLGDVSDPHTWSGTPASLLAALRELGVEVSTIDARPPGRLRGLARDAVALRRLRRSRRDSLRETVAAARGAALVAPESAPVYGWAVRRRLRADRALDGAIQLGSEYRLPSGLPFVTFEDMTIAQALAPEARAYYRPWDDFSQREIERLLALQRSIYASARACCTATPWAADSVAADYAQPSDKVHVVGLGRNVEPPGCDRAWSPPRFLFVGVDWERKNGPAVLRAFARVRGSAPDAQLDVVGGHPPIDAEGVTGHGQLSRSSADEAQRLEQLFAAATCFVMPSRHEAAGIVFLEAAAAGLPSIAGTSGGAASLVGEGGLAVDPDDGEALAEAMLRLADPDEARRLGARAKARSELFTWRSTAERLVRALAPPGVELDGLAPYLS